MTKKHLFKTAAVLIALMTAFTFAGCSKKKMADVNSIDVTQATVSKETSSLASKELTKTGIVTFDYTDEKGNTVRLEGKAVAGENGEATIEVVDADGNKAVFTGKASTVDGKLTVSDIKVKEAGTLVKNDGTQIEVTENAEIKDAEETDSNEKSDIAASEEVKNEVKEAQEEEKKIEEAREEIKNTEASNVANNNDGNNKNNGNDEKPTEPAPAPTEPTPEPTEPAPAPTEPTPEPTEPAPAPTEPTPEPTEPAPKPTEPETDSRYDGIPDGYPHSVVEGPNGWQYAGNSNTVQCKGQDVKQGTDVECPYQLSTYTTRYTVNPHTEEFETKYGFYYIGINDGDMNDSDWQLFEQLGEQYGWMMGVCQKIGTFSCGEVWFLIFD